MPQEYGPYAHRDPNADPRLPPLGVFVYEQAVRDEIESERQGAPIYDNAVMLRIVIPGAKNSWPIYEIERTKADGTVKVDRAVMARFRGVYEQFRQNRTPAQTGTPLEQWPLMDVPLVAAFKEYNVFTVQQLAALSDAFVDNIRVPKVREWRAKAHAWVSEASDAAAIIAAQAENARLREEIEELRRLVNERLSAQNRTEGFDEAPRRQRRRARTEGDDIPIAMPDDDEQMALEGERL